MATVREQELVMLPGTSTRKTTEQQIFSVDLLALTPAHIVKIEICEGCSSVAQIGFCQHVTNVPTWH